jgi:hypothetical protein
VWLVVAWAVVARHSAAVVAWAESFMVDQRWRRAKSITVHTERRRMSRGKNSMVQHPALHAIYTMLAVIADLLCLAEQALRLAPVERKYDCSESRSRYQ